MRSRGIPRTAPIVVAVIEATLTWFTHIQAAYEDEASGGTCPDGCAGVLSCKFFGLRCAMFASQLRASCFWLLAFGLWLVSAESEIKPNPPIVNMGNFPNYAIKSQQLKANDQQPMSSQVLNSTTLIGH